MTKICSFYLIEAQCHATIELNLFLISVKLILISSVFVDIFLSGVTAGARTV